MASSSGLAFIIASVALLLLVVGAFVVVMRLVNHHVTLPSREVQRIDELKKHLDAQVRQIEEDVASEFKQVKLRIVHLEGR